MKLLVVFILLFFGIFAQRFQRHLINATQNGYIYGNTKMDNLDAFLADGDNYEQSGGDVKFVRDGGEVELELENKELKFKFCSDGCMGETVVVCYDAENRDPSLLGNCRSNQCVIQAGVQKEGGLNSLTRNILWLMTTGNVISFSDNEKKCATVVIKSPRATAEGFQPFPSCDPKKYDGNLIKLSVRGVNYGCPLYVLNAKKWSSPLTTLPTFQNSSKIPQTTSKSSEANTTLWIGIGVAFFILLIVLIGFGYCCYRTEIQKKPLFGKKKELQQKAFIPEASKKANVVKEKTEDENEVVAAKPESTKDATKEEIAKEKQPKPTKKMIPEKKAIVEAKPSKEVTQENATKEDAPQKKVSVEPTLEAPTTDASVVQKPIVQKKYPKPGDPPRVYVPNKVILPAPKSVNAPKSGSLSGKKDSLSGRHEIGMQSLVQSSPECVKRLNFGELIAETKEKLDKFYPPGTVRNFDPREIELLCCARISVMFKIIEALVDNSIKALAERGVTFDEKCNIIEMPPKAEKYLHKKSTPEFVRSFAFGNVFRKYIDSQSNIYENFSIPLLFSIVLQRRYTVYNRRKACTWIRRELPIIEKEFNTKERSKFAYPICAIEAACKMNADGFKDVVLLNTLSGDDDDDQTQNSTRASEKLGKN